MTTIWFYLGPAALALVAYFIGSDFKKKFALLEDLHERVNILSRRLKRAEAESVAQKILIDDLRLRVEEITKEFRYELQSMRDKMQSQEDKIKPPTRTGPVKTGQPRVATWTQFQRDLERAKDAQG